MPECECLGMPPRHAGKPARESGLTPMTPRVRTERLEANEKEAPMKALVYHGPASRSWDEVPDPPIEAATDIVMRVDAATICGTDLHILKGDVPEVEPGTILGHEAVLEGVKHQNLPADEAPVTAGASRGGA
jgi:hypothetical protein